MQLLRRWTTFNVVGAMGMGVQLVVLSALLQSEVHYVAATAIAVEAALVHNFFWHLRWTWRDRPAATAGTVAARLASYHLTNGAVSLLGNVAFMIALAGGLGLDPLLANGTAIVMCSLVNFAASNVFVFSKRPVIASLRTAHDPAWLPGTRHPPR